VAKNDIEGRTSKKAMEEKLALESALRHDSEDERTIKDRLENIASILYHLDTLVMDTNKALNIVSDGNSNRSVVVMRLEDQEDDSRRTYSGTRANSVQSDYGHRGTVCEIDFGGSEPEVKVTRTKRRKKKKYRLGNLHRNNPRKWRRDD